MKNVGSVYRRHVISGVLQEFLGTFISLFPIPNIHTGPEFRSTRLHGVLPFPCPLDYLCRASRILQRTDCYLK